MESKVQNKLIKILERSGWYVVKLMKTNKNGICDLLCLHSTKKSRFIEVKDKNGELSALQIYRAKEIYQKTGIKAELYHYDKFIEMATTDFKQIIESII